MMMFKALIVFFCFVLPVGLRAMQADTGSLVIVGGGLEPDNHEVFEALISKAGSKKNATFAVIPAAGGAPVQSFAYFRSELIAYGIQPGNIHLIPISMMDDDSTSDVNEASWAGNGQDTSLANLVRSCSAVWFTGGDQLRIARTLVRGDGSPTPVLQAVWEVFRRGGVIGGTSAGAAIMSHPMIGAGTSLAAVEPGMVTEYAGNEFPDDSAVFITTGLGFFPDGLVDQHFNQRARLGRLAFVLMNSPYGKVSDRKYRYGFGVDENTAMIYEAATHRFQVAGTGGVTILDAVEARKILSGNHTGIENLMLSYLVSGDSFDCTAGTVIPGKDKNRISGLERFNEPFPNRCGLLAPYPESFDDLYTRYFADNKGNGPVKAITLLSESEGILTTLKKKSSTAIFFSEDASGERHFTISGAMLSLTPFILTINAENHD